MKLIELLKYVKPIAIIGNADVDITGVNIDSRKIEKGHLFVAIKGTQTDGHRFIPKALELGAVAVLCEDLPVPDGEVGEIVVTTLGVEGMPLLRFRTGDMAAKVTEQCKCGRWSYRLEWWLMENRREW